MVKTRIDDPLTADQLRALLDYDPETGIFRWRPRTNCRREWNTRYAGTIAGTQTKHLGYIQIAVYGRLYLAQRLAWLWMTGSWSTSEEIDHWDTNTSNNRWGNLREATSSQNKMNRPNRSDNTSGYKGVWWEKRRSKWVADIMVDSKRRHLGYFPTAEAAHAAYCEAAARLHKEFARFE
jgi:hypothetical protein